jgi:hypothetical protein
MSDILPKIGQLPGLVVVTAVQRQESVACDNAAKRPPAHHGPTGVPPLPSRADTSYSAHGDPEISKIDLGRILFFWLNGESGLFARRWRCSGMA